MLDKFWVVIYRVQINMFLGRLTLTSEEARRAHGPRSPTLSQQVMSTKKYIAHSRSVSAAPSYLHTDSIIATRNAPMTLYQRYVSSHIALDIKQILVKQIKLLHTDLRDARGRKQAGISKRKAFANQMSITLLIERQNPITRLNRSDRGASELRVALRADALVGAGSGMRSSDLRVGHCGSPHRGAWVRRATGQVATALPPARLRRGACPWLERMRY